MRSIQSILFTVALFAATCGWSEISACGQEIISDGARNPKSQSVLVSPDEVVGEKLGAPIKPVAVNPSMLAPRVATPISATSSDIKAGTHFDQPLANRPVPPASLTQMGNDSQPVKPNSQSIDGQVNLQVVYPNAVNLQELAEIKLVAKNQAARAVEDVKITVELPSHVKFSDATPFPIETNENRLTFVIDSIAAQAVSEIKLHVIPTDKQPVNIQTELHIVNRERLEFNVQQPILNVQVNGAKQGVLGEITTHEIVITNNGDGRAKNVNLDIQLPAGLEVLEPLKQPVTLTELNVGQSQTISIKAKCVIDGEQEIQVFATADACEPAEKTLALNILRPEIEVAASGPNVGFVNRESLYSIKVSNPGKVAVNHVEVNLTLPAIMSVNTISREAKYDAKSNQLTWNIDRVEAGADLVIQWISTAKQEGAANCTIQIDSAETEAKDVKLQTQISSRVDLSLQLRSLTDPAPINSPVTYHLFIENYGTTTARDVNVQVELPEGWLGSRMEGDQTSRPTANALVLQIPVIEPGKRAEIPFQVVGNAGGEFVIRATVSSSGTSAVAVEDSLLLYESDTNRVVELLDSVIR